MNKKWIVLLVFVMGFLSLVSAQQSLGTFQKNECVTLIQTCASCTYVNFTSVLYPNSTNALVSPIASTQSGTEYTYDFCNTTEIGTYIVNGLGDVDTTPTVFAYDFEITPTGNVTPEGVSNVYGIIIFVIFGMAIFFLFLSSQLNDVGPKIFCLLSSFIFLIASLLLGNSFIQTYNIVEGLSDNVSYIFYAVGLIFFVIFAYIMIRQSVAAFDAMQVSKGLKMGEQTMYMNAGRTVAGYDTRRAY